MNLPCFPSRTDASRGRTEGPPNSEDRAGHVGQLHGAGHTAFQGTLTILSLHLLPLCPHSQYDKDWVGDPPERDVFVIGLNEAMKSSLRETCSQLYPIHAIKFHHHPKTRTFLGAATVAFTHTGHGKKAVGELDGKIVGGCYLRAELDDKGTTSQQYSNEYRAANSTLVSTEHVID